MKKFMCLCGSKKETKFFLLLLVFLFLFSVRSANAAELKLSPSSGSYSVGDTIKVRVVLSSPIQSSNAVSGGVSFSKDLLTLTSISKSNSIISLWAVEPTYSNVNGTADLEGIILNGYVGSNGTVATLVFKAKAEGNAEIKFSTSSVLANDGQGTNILTDTGQSYLEISKSKEGPSPSTQGPGITIEELKKQDEAMASSKFLITSTDKKDSTSYKIEIDGVAYPWTNQDSGIYETPTLPKGTHILKVTMETADGFVSATRSFEINAISAPVITEFSENISEKEYIVVKGLADPNINVVINSDAVIDDGNQSLNKVTVVKSDEKGLFTYVSEKAVAGIYEITAFSRTDSGVESEKSEAVKITVHSLPSTIANGIMNTFSLLVPLLALVLLLILLGTWGWYRVLHYREKLHKKLMHAKSTIMRSFGILDEDVEEEIKLFRKVKGLHPLTEEDRNLLNQFKKDIEEAEKVILNEVKE